MAKTDKQISEEKTAAASYILNFYQTVQNLNHNYSTYLNHLILLENASKGEDKEAKAATVGNRSQLLELVQSIRYYCTQAYINYCTIMEGISKETDDKIEKNYNALLNQLVPDRNMVKNFVVSMNTSLMKDIVKRLLESSQDVLNNLMGHDVNEPKSS